ncbi:LacI family DNA-binding transcriptional regulator [Microbacterium imperiale]|uniref:LacI family transcriptional regulator n=1 Tax=Microbacterium imperiale TaxID=33884 RepID=A0A9W6M3H5_9MICO|nr:LacI family DNA-binding transcriptional regulator [Microbacterium imperiale]MBP2420503.1 DNA-binding LacI/PurR family transcriptional regulator [Microbacterium imperiale]MDS0200551.1 LacI family transcriptional regulator [Microbacterium imperiale]BFE40844.1 LacI family DNA-binding transcriptional regulator [Microbacterium imperiale]GLJ79981.1 LacI family transcriptional regulator [Microbacterium imperiale]
MTTPRKRATIADIARRLGVSKAAVSFALNDRPGVSTDLRERVLAVAAELRYRPNSAALALGRARVDVIGLVLNRPARTLGTESFFPELMAGIQAGLAETHTGLQTLVVASLDEELAAYGTWQSAQRVDGVIVVDPRRDDARIALLDELGLPAVQIGSHPSDDPLIPSVWIDDHAVATALFDTLFELGHRRVAHVMGPLDFEHTELRRAALRECAGRYRAPEPRSVETDYSAEQSAEATRSLLQDGGRPTAIVYDNDVMALAGLRVAQELGVAVPADLSLASFDDSIAMRLVRPSITALTRDTYALGELAARTLMDVIATAGPVSSVPAMPPTLSARESTAPLTDQRGGANTSS